MSEPPQGPGARLLAMLRGDGLVGSLIRGAGTFLVIQGLGMGLGFGMNVLLARAMGAGSYGTYVLALTWIGALGIAARAGFGTASVRFVSELRASGSFALLAGFVRTSFGSVAIASLALAAVGAGVVALLGGRVSEPLAATLAVGLLALPVLALLEVCSASLRGLLRGGTALVPGRILQPLGVVLAVLVWSFVLERGLTPSYAMGLYLGAGLLALAFAGAALRRAAPAEMRGVTPAYDRATWLRAAGPLFLINATQFVLQRVDLLLIGLLLGSVEAGLYAPAMRIAALIDFCLVAVNWWAGPLIARTHTSDRPAELQQLLRRAAQVTLALTVVAVAVVLLLGRHILGLFGPEFVAAEGALRIRAVGSLVNALVGPVGLLLTMTGRQATAARVMGLYAGLGVVLNLVLLPVLGIEGAALAAALTTIGWNVHLAVLVWTRLRLRTTAI